MRSMPVMGRWMATPQSTAGTVAVIKLDGVIAKSDPASVRDRGKVNLEKFKIWADSAFAVKNLRAVALDITCPGGSPTQCELMFNYLRAKAHKADVPVLSFANDVAASGGYWMMCAGDELYACRTSIVGSIGVIGPQFGFVELMRRLGIERRLLVAGKSKVTMDPFSEVTQEQRQRSEAIMSSLHGTFMELVRERRGAKLPQDCSEVFSGRVYTGAEAVQVGLVDGVGDLSGIVRERFGDNVRLETFGPKRQMPAWWPVQSLAWGGTHDVAVEMVDAMSDHVQTRMLWARYGL